MDERILFTKEMKKNYKILIPTMLPRHFKLIGRLMKNFGYDTELLENEGPRVMECGLKYVHNDTCYPALLIIGQFIDALQSGKYDTDKTALIYFQTGGGCRASNYISLLRKALTKAGFGHVPVISLNFMGLEKNPGFHLTVPMFRAMMYAVMYGDLLMYLINRCLPYEINKGETEALADRWTDKLAQEMERPSLLHYGRIKKNWVEIVKSFQAIERTKEKKIPVGIVGEIFVKFSPLANNHLEDFLRAEGAETILGGLVDFALFYVCIAETERKKYKRKRLKSMIFAFFYRFILKKQRLMNRYITEFSDFPAPPDFEVTRHAIDGYIDNGVQMGEGWLLVAEMIEHIQSGTPNVVCVQPFGCLPNHIVGKGVIKPIRENNPTANIAAIDYDASASLINQQNRLKMMLANARRNEEKAEASKPEEKHKETT